MGASPGVLQGIMGNAGEIQKEDILRQQAQQSQAMAPLQQGLAREQLTGAQQENQLRAIQMKDASIMGMAMQRNPGDMNAALDWAMQNGASAPTIISYRQKQAEMAKTMADTQSLQAGAAEKTSNIAKLEDESYDTALGAALRQSKQEGWNPLELRKNFDIQASMNPNPRVGQRLRAFIAGIPQDPTAAQQYLEGGYAKTGAAKQETEMAKEGAETAASQATTAEKTQQTRIEKIKADAMEQFTKNPQAGPAAIDQITKGPMNGVYKAEYQAAMSMGDMEGAKAAIQHAAEYAARVAQATDPTILKAQLNQKVAEEVATAPIKRANAVAEAQVLNGQTGDVANVPVHQIAAARSDYNKSGQALANAQSAADEMQSFIDMAKSGNKVAYAYAPTTGVLTINSANGTKRVNMAEIHNYGAAGSDLDRIEGWLGKHVTGDSIDSSILNDMQSVHQNLMGVAQQKHANEVKSINNSYGSTFKPMQFKANAPAAGGPKVIATQADYDGLPAGAQYVNPKDGKTYIKK